MGCTLIPLTVSYYLSKKLLPQPLQSLKDRRITALSTHIFLHQNNTLLSIVYIYHTVEQCLVITVQETDEGDDVVQRMPALSDPDDPDILPGPKNKQSRKVYLWLKCAIWLGDKRLALSPAKPQTL